MLSIAGTLLILALLLFLWQLLNLGTFDAKAGGLDILPISIRATSQADYSRDSYSFSVPPVSENILVQIITDIPSNGTPQDRLGTLQASLLTPVPTMTPDHRFPTSSPTLPAPTATYANASSTSPASVTPLATATRYISPTPTVTSFYSSNDSPLPTSTKTPKPATKTSIPSRTATVTLTQTRTATLTVTASSTVTNTPTSTSTVTSTLIATSTSTSTFAPSPTVTSTLTQTRTATLTVTASATLTNTPIHPPTVTDTSTATFTPTGTPTLTPSPTSTFTPTFTPSLTNTLTPTFTPTFTPSITNTLTPTATETPTNSPTYSPTPTDLPTPTYTPTETPTLIPTATDTPTLTPTNSPTYTPTYTATFTPTLTFTPTTTFTPSPTSAPGLPACYSGTPNGLLPSDDTYINSSQPLNNYGADNTFDVRPDNGASNRGLVKFNLSSIPADSTVTSATLYLNEKHKKSGQTTYIYRVTSNWNENTVTWLSWSLLGGDFDSGISYFTFLPDQQDCMLTMDITSLVQAWVNGTYPNYGLMLYSTGPNQAISYYSKEDGTASRHPKLDIIYTP